LTTPNNKTNPQRAQQLGPFGYHWRSIGRVLWEGKVSALAIWLTLTLAVVLVVRMLPSVYKADCLMLVVGQKIPEKYVASTVTSAPQERLAAISHLILSNERLESIISTFHLYEADRGAVPQEDIVKRMREKDIELTLEAGLSETRPDAIRISYQAKDPKTAADVTNRLASLIIAENSRSRQGRATDTSQFIESQLQEARQRLDKLEAQVSQFKVAHNGELPEQETSLNGSLARLQVRLQGNQEAVNRAEQSKILFENNLTQAESSLATLERSALEAKEAAKRKAAAAVADPAAFGPLARPKTRAEILQEELASLRQRYGKDHPEIRRRVAELAELPVEKADNAGETAKPSAANARAQAVLDQEAAALPAGLEAAIVVQKERVADLRVQRELTVKEIATTNAERQRIGQEIEADQARIDKLPIREQEMAALTRDYEIAKENYKSLLDKRLSAGMASEMESSQQGEEFTLIEPARTPQRPFKPKRELLYAAGGILSLAISVLVVLGIRLPQDKVVGEWELGPGVVILGRVPQIKPQKGRIVSFDTGGAT
jgi:polysaccharide biosynthesis transport protein